MMYIGVVECSNYLQYCVYRADMREELVPESLPF